MPTTRFRLLLLLACALGSSCALAGEITLFENEGFGGRRVTLRDALPNFDVTSFNDRAASIIVRDGLWEVCTDAYFRGRCMRLGPGEYGDLSGALFKSISSAREVRGPEGPPSGETRIELFERREFGGRSITLTSGVYDFARIEFNDTADAAVVSGGVWRLCEDAGLKGQCRDFSPGRYNDLGYLGNRVSSAAIVAAGGGGGWRPAGRPQATLYEYPDFGGRSFSLENDVVSNFDRTGFNDRASSIRIDGGYWLFCTDANFQGTCRTFGPGEYARLPFEVNHRISSGRRIHEHYPYNAPPAWQR